MVDGPDREFSTDNVIAGEGDDLVAARNKPAHKDLVVCGDVFDRVMADSKDVVAADCERVADTRPKWTRCSGPSRRASGKVCLGYERV